MDKNIARLRRAKTTRSHIRDLGVEVLAGAQHGQARDAEFADVRTRGLGAAETGDVLVHGLLPRGTRRP